MVPLSRYSIVNLEFILNVCVIASVLVEIHRLFCLWKKRNDEGMFAGEGVLVKFIFGELPLMLTEFCQ